MSGLPAAVVGIAVHAEPARFRATLAAVRATVSSDTRVVVIPDHPDAATAAALAADPSLELLAAPGAQGSAACFNRLLGATDDAVCVLLESGCLPAPRWLHHLLDALDGDPRRGLAGPSTNRAWNEQRVEATLPGREREIAAAGRRLQASRGGEAVSLAPLYSLAEFCYAVRRRVWNDIGAADEGYGPGPCWEMDYNARAARAGWSGVWVPAAFVWRAPFTARRGRHEQALFERNRHRYQDRLCGLRLRGEPAGYQERCRGDACEHFAPPGLVQLRMEPARPAPPRAPPARRPAVPAVPAAAAPNATPPAPNPPLISCIMPTRGRPHFALQAVRYFLAQDYPSRELIILDDEGGELAERLPRDPRIRLETRPAGESIGAKRNRGVQLARGEIVAQWDDDDWFAPGRLSAQAAPILAGAADVTALRTEVFMDLARWRFWACTPGLHRKLFVLDVHGGTLVYRRALWDGGSAYPAASLAEDAAFLRRVVNRGARLRRVDTPGLFVYLRHGGNAWSFACGAHVDPRGWHAAAEPPHLGADRAFYAALSPAAAESGEAWSRPASSRPASPPAPSHPSAAPVPVRTAAGAGAAPLVSCLMPTANRRSFVPRAIELFLRQDYPNRELVIVDDGADAVADLVPADPRIRYLRTERGLTLGGKRNLACTRARGELLAHWDDDDWSADDRLSRQVQALERRRAQVCGLSAVRYFDPVAGRAWEYRWPGGARPWLGGSTLLFRRSAWEQRPFPELNEGEDTRWVWSLPPTAVAALPDPGWFAALVHPRNTSRKETRGPNWRPLPLDVVKGALGPDWAFYAALAQPHRLATPRTL